MSQPKSEFDTPWKYILNGYFEHFIALCWPSKYPLIDWKKGYRSLDKELSKITRNAPITNRVADKLMEVSLKNGTDIFILIHVEVQGQYDKYFEERMFVYYYRLRDLYKKPIASLAVLIDANPNWRPSTYQEDFWESSVAMKFNSIKLLDYQPRMQELERSNNPFASVILAQLTALEKQTPEAKLISKVNLIKWLFRRQWKKDDIVNLITFVDWVLALPAPLEIQFREMIEKVEEELKVSYITSFERTGIEKGIQQGESAMLLCFLEGKFKHISDAYREKISTADPKTLLTWAKKVVDSQVIEDVFNT